MNDPNDFAPRPSGRYIGEMQMRGCRPVIIGPEGHEIEPECELIAELVRKMAKRINRENREAN